MWPEIKVVIRHTVEEQKLFGLTLGFITAGLELKSGRVQEGWAGLSPTNIKKKFIPSSVTQKILYMCY